MNVSLKSERRGLLRMCELVERWGSQSHGGWYCPQYIALFMMGWQGISWLEVKRFGVREIHSGTSRVVLLVRHCSARPYDGRELATRNNSSSSSLFIIPFADSGLLFFTLDRPFWRSFAVTVPNLFESNSLATFITGRLTRSLAVSASWAHLTCAVIIFSITPLERLSRTLVYFCSHLTQNPGLCIHLPPGVDRISHLPSLSHALAVLDVTL